MLTRVAACIYKRSHSNAGTVCCAADCGVRQEDDWRVKLNVKVDLVLCKIQIQLHICGSNGLQSLSAGPVGGSRCRSVRSVWLEIVFTAVQAS